MRRTLWTLPALFLLTLAISAAYAQPPAPSTRELGGPWSWAAAGSMAPAAAMQFGHVAEIDANTTSLRLDTQKTWVAVNAKTRLARRTPITAADLQIGQTIRITVTAMAVTARSVTVDDPALISPAAAAAAAAGPLPAAGAAGPAPGAPSRIDPAHAQPVAITGKVTALDPLVLTLDNGLAISVTLAEEAQLSQVKPVTLADLKVGEAVYALGDTAADGTLNAKYVYVDGTVPPPNP